MRAESLVWLRTSLVILFGVLLSSCGLPQLVFLAPPIVDQRSPEAGRGFFSHNTANTMDEFRGYDIWYKIYPDDESGHARATQDSDALKSDTIGVGISPLQVRGFSRVISYDRAVPTSYDRTAITLPVNNLANSQNYEVDFTEANNAASVPSELATSDILLRFDAAGTLNRGLRRRNLDIFASEPGSHASFWDNSKYKDAVSVPQEAADLVPSNWREAIKNHAGDSNPRFLILLYIISVGTDSRSLTPIYSEPRQIRGNDHADGFFISPR